MAFSTPPGNHDCCDSVSLAMQQTETPAPAQAPAAPAAPAAPQPTAVALPGGANIPLTGIPTSSSEVEGLRERRDVLRDNLERALNRRATLVNQMQDGEGRTVSPEAKVGMQQRLNLLDERILQIERDQALTERLISSAPPEVLAEAAFISERNSPSTMNEDEAIGMSMGTFGLGILLTLAISRWRRRRAAKRGGAGTKAVAVLAEDDPRIERLAQTVDAMAEELERIGEGQRFVTQLLSKRQEAVPVYRSES